MDKLRTVLRAAKKTDLVWRYVSNLSPTFGYRVGSGKRITDLESDLVAKLHPDGMIVTTIDALLGRGLEFDQLNTAVAGLLANKRVEIEQLRSSAGNEMPIGSKTFNLEILGSEVVFDADSVFARVALNDTFLNIANAYFEMYAKLRYYNVWYTAATKSTARESQLWHYDREDNYILKVFLYLEDVDEGTGPFTYAPGTHRKGRYKSLRPQYFDEGGVKRTTDEQMAAVYPREKWKVCTGKKGTIIFADTRGYHKGGEARTKDRLMYTCMFTSPASESKQLIRFPEDICLDTLTPRQRKALYL